MARKKSEMEKNGYTEASCVVARISQAKFHEAWKFWEFLNEAGGVRRCHTARMLMPENVAEHSWGVAAIITRIDPDKSYDLLKAAIFHDAAEYVTGDIPSPTKSALIQNFGIEKWLVDWEKDVLKRFGIKWKLTKKQELLLKWADLLHLYSVCIREWKMGNTTFAKYVTKLDGYLRVMECPNDETLALWEAISGYSDERESDIVEYF